MVLFDDLVRAIVSGDSLAVRSLLQDLLRQCPCPTDWAEPTTADPVLRAAGAATAELCASRLGAEPPSWAGAVGPAPNPVYLVKSALEMRRLRALCRTESPEPFSKRRLFVPPDFLASA